MYRYCTIHSFVYQVGPGLVFLLFNHCYLGRGLLVHCVTPVEPLLQCVTHTMFYQSNIPPVVPKFILRAESIQVKHVLDHIFFIMDESFIKEKCEIISNNDPRSHPVTDANQYESPVYQH